MILALIFGRLQTIREAAAEFSLAPAILRAWVSDGVLQHLVRRGRILVNRDEVVRAVAHSEDWQGRPIRVGTGARRRTGTTVPQSATSKPKRASDLPPSTDLPGTIP